MPKSICKFSGCNRIISGNKRYCTEHEEYFKLLKTEHNQRYDKKIRRIRDKKYTVFYHSGEWERLRDTVIKKYKGLDLFAYYIENSIVAATIGHHIIELKEDWSKRLTIDNIIPVSDRSHKKLHLLYKQDKKGTQELLKKILQKAKKIQDRGA